MDDSSGGWNAMCLKISAISIVSLALSGVANADTRMETVGSLLLRTQEESAAPHVEYCGRELPKLRRSLDAEYASFRKKFRKATMPLRARLESDEVLSQSATPRLRAQFEALRAEDQARVSGLDPQVFCLKLKQDLADATPESIQRNMQSAFSQYRAAVRTGH